MNSSWPGLTLGFVPLSGPGVERSLSDPEPQNLTTGTMPRRRLVTMACLMAQFMAAVEGTIVATAMPSIVGELGGFHLFSWAFAAYLLAQAVTTPIYGRLADLYGRKRV